MSVLPCLLRTLNDFLLIPFKMTSKVLHFSVAIRIEELQQKMPSSLREFNKDVYSLVGKSPKNKATEKTPSHPPALSCCPAVAGLPTRGGPGK